MIHYFKTGLVIITSCLFVACHSNDKQPPMDIKKTEDSMQVEKPAKIFEDIQFASKRDTSCGMPLSAGIEDTLVLNGKVYGFCCKECKDDFAAVLTKQHKR